MPINISYQSLIPPLPSLPGLPFGSALTSVPQPGVPVNVAFPVDTNPDELASLLPLVLKDASQSTSISFPGIEVREQFTNDLAIYKYPNRDGARIDNMGANPEIWTIRAVLINNIWPGANENWTQGQLFPNVYNQLTALLKSSGSYKILQHPIYGNVTVQVIGVDPAIVAKGPRDGVYMDIHLIKTIVDNPTRNYVPFVNIIKAGQNVTVALNSLPAGPPDFPAPPGLSLAQFFSVLSATIQNVINAPTDFVEGVLDETLILKTSITGFLPSIANGFFQSLSNLEQTAAALTAPYKSAPGNCYLAAPVTGSTKTNQYNTTNPLTNIGSGMVSQINKQLSPNVLAPAFNMADAAMQARQTLISLNNNRSKNAYDFLDKAQTATNNLMNYYIAMNRVEVSQVISSLTSFMYNLQQVQKTIQNNSGTSTATQLAKVSNAIYVTKTSISWYALSQLLNNDVNDLFSLNQNIQPTLLIPNNTTINYLQGQV